MNYTPPFSDRDIEKTIWLGESYARKGARLISADKHGYINDTSRATDTATIMPEKESLWLYEKMTPFFFNFNYHGFEPFQYLVYPPGGFFIWHNDNAYGEGHAKSVIGHRIATAIVNLSDPEEYTGGGLQIEVRRGPFPGAGDVINAPREKGRVSVFSSELYHTALPVRTGIRRVLVCWALIH